MAIVPTWYEMSHRFSHRHNIEFNRSKIRALPPIITGKTIMVWSLYNYMLIWSLRIIKNSGIIK